MKSGSGERAAPAHPLPPCLYIDIYSVFFLSLSEKPPQDAAEDNPSFLPRSSSCFFPNSFIIILIMLLLLLLVIRNPLSPVPMPLTLCTPC